MLQILSKPLHSVAFQIIEALETGGSIFIGSVSVTKSQGPWILKFLDTATESVLMFIFENAHG